MRIGRFLTLILSIAMLGIPAFAEIIIDFSGGAAGNVTGTATTLTATGVLIDSVTGIGTPQNAGPHAVGSGTLAISALGGSFASGIYTYTSGTYNITGGVAAAGIATGTALLTGTITKLTVDLASAKVVLASGSDTKNLTLVQYFCPACTANAWVFTGGSTHLNNITGGAGGAYTATTFSTDIPNTYIPEPASISLLGTALFGACLVIRRRLRA